jgi:RNA polymerase sigma factor (sigma-70 family)
VAKTNTSRLKSQIQALYGIGAFRELSDGQLLERFATERGEAAELAFAALVERHGPMVLRVCRSALSNWHDIEDAFQATFLVLVRKSRSLWVRDSLGPWLYRVALRTAKSARAANGRRRHREEQMRDLTGEEAPPTADDVGQILHEEIERLPERFRIPFVLCELENRTHQQAARHLGWPIGTVKSRLARGRMRLRERLFRRGLSPDAGFLVASVRNGSSIAVGLPGLIDSTARAALQFASGRAIRMECSASLAHTLLRIMFVSQLLKAAAIGLAMVSVSAGAGLLVVQRGQNPTSPKTSAPARISNRAEIQAEQFPEGTIARIDFEGKGTQGIELQVKLLSRVGEPLNHEKLEIDLKSLLKTKRFSQAIYLLDETPPKSKQYSVTFLLSDRELIGTLRRGQFRAVVSESGIVATSASWRVICEVEGRSTIKWLAPEKLIVKKGDLIARLDSQMLEAQLKKQLEIVKTAEDACWSARTACEVAELSLLEYQDGVAVQEQITLQDAITLAVVAAKKADDRLTRTRRANQRIHDAIEKEKNAQTPANILAELDISDRLEAAEENAGQKAKALDVAKVRRENHNRNVVPAKVEEFKVNLVRARDKARAALSILNAEKAKKDSLDRQIKNCRFYAPGDGMIEYANDTRFGNRPAIAIGATVRERQVIFRIANLKSSLRVITRVPEWSINHVKPGVKAQIKAPDAAGQPLRGTVVEVAPLPDVRSYFGRGPNVYTIWLRIDDPPAWLVPDANVIVEIDIADFENILSVPARAVVAVNGRDHVAIKKPGGGFEWRAVSLGVTNAHSVEIRTGLSPGEQAILEPLELQGGPDKDQMPHAPTAPRRSGAGAR